jgi:hypothetical protein
VDWEYKLQKAKAEGEKIAKAEGKGRRLRANKGFEP